MVKLSIITINYNNSNGLLKTLESVVGQSYSDIEYIVIDGASKDDSIRHIEKFSSKISYWISEPDRGIYNAMNKGIKASTGEYLLFLNSGDILYDNYVIESIISSLNTTDFIIGRIMFDNTREINTLPHDISLLRFIEKSIPHPSTFIRRDVMIKYMYDETLKIVADWKFFMQAIIFDNASYRYLDTIIVLFETSGISSVNKCAVDRERELVLKELLPDRVYIDYLRFIYGSNYSDDQYDKLFLKIKNVSVGRILYTFTVMLLKILSLFKRNLRFIKDYPMIMNRS